ncbi:MAG TPA: tetratricopeptide repeat protein, partial [Chroococcales cyanobacterium]
EQSERRKKALKSIFGKKQLFLAGTLVFFFFASKQLFFKPKSEVAAPSSNPSSSASRNPLLGQHPTYGVDIDAVISGIEKGKENPLEVAMKPATGTSVGDALHRTGASSGTFLPMVPPAEVVPLRTIGDPTLSSFALSQELAKNSLLLRERPEDPKPLIKMGDALYGQGKPMEAIKNYREAITRDPKSATAYQQIGVLLEGQGKLPEAKTELEKASQLAPLNPSVQRDYGNLLEGMGQHEKAIEVYQQAIAADPNDHRAYTRMGIALRSKQDSAGALLCFKQAQVIEPEDPYSSYQLASTLEGSGKNDEAGKEYGRASALLDRTAEKSLRVGISCAKKGNYQGLIFHFGEAVRSKGLHANAQINIGKLLLFKKDFKGSVAYFNRAKGIYRRNAALHQGMGEAYLALKDKERASLEFTDANKIDPKLAKPYYFLGVACQEEEKNPLALELFDRFLTLAQEGPLTKNAREREEVLRAKK